MNNQNDLEGLNLIMTALYILNDNVQMKVHNYIMNAPRKIKKCLNNNKIFSKKEKKDDLWTYEYDFDLNLSTMIHLNDRNACIAGDSMLELYQYDNDLKSLPVSFDNEPVLSFTEVYMSYLGEDGRNEYRTQRYDMTVIREKENKYSFYLYRSSDKQEFHRVNKVEMDFYDIDSSEAKQIMGSMGMQDPTK